MSRQTTARAEPIPVRTHVDGGPDLVEMREALDAAYVRVTKVFEGVEQSATLKFTQDERVAWAHSFMGAFGVTAREVYVEI